MIESKDISVVVQGPVCSVTTPRCLKSIRYHLPDSKIILSTWVGSDLSTVNSLCDTVVLNEDPGQVVWYRRPDTEENTIFSNVNRLIVSTQSGLARVDTKYALKFRSDLELVHSGFLNHYKQYPDYEERYKCVRNRVLIWNLYSRNPYLKNSFPYHFSDVVLFGLTQDLKDIWDVSNMSTDGDLIRYGKVEVARFAPEQYIWLNYFRKFREVECAQGWLTDRKVFAESENYMLNNVLLLSLEQFGFDVFKKELLGHRAWDCYTHADWMALYRYRFSGEISSGYIWLKFKEVIPYGFPHFVFRKFIKALACLLPNNKLRRKVRGLYNW